MGIKPGRKTNPGGSLSNIVYSDSLRTKTVTDENGGIVRTTYNRLGHPALVQEVTGTAYKMASYTYHGTSLFISAPKMTTNFF
jgi:hypothetical protein